MATIYTNQHTDLDNYSSSTKSACGFPSPADNYLANKLDLNQLLIKHPAATFFVRVKGDSMTGAGICCGDLLIVDRSLTPTDGAVIIAIVAGELTVKSLYIKKDKAYLVPANPNYEAIEIKEKNSLQCWGVVTHAIHDVRKY